MTEESVTNVRVVWQGREREMVPKEACRDADPVSNTTTLPCPAEGGQDHLTNVKVVDSYGGRHGVAFELQTFPGYLSGAIYIYTIVQSPVCPLDTHLHLPSCVRPSPARDGE